MTPNSFVLPSHLTKFSLIAVFLVVSTLAGNTFKSTTQTKISLSSVPTSVRINSYSETQVAVGLTNGTIHVYSITNYSLRSILSGCHYYPIKDIKEVRGNGWMSLDIYNTACRWNSSGYNTMKWSFAYNVIDMSLTFQTFGYAYVGFNFGDQVYEYSSETTTNVTRMIYNTSSTNRFVRIQYDGYGSRLLASISGSNTIYAYNCSNGQYLTSPAYTSYSLLSFNKVSNGDIVFTDGSYVYRMNSSYSYWRSSASVALDTVVGSYKNSEFLFISMLTNSSSSLKVLDSNGYFKQSLDYAYSSYKAIDASTNYLVYADSYGYLGIATYAKDVSPVVIDVTFPVWAIILISLTFFLICVVAIVVCVVKARKRRLAIAANGYNRFDGPQATTAFLPNPQPYNPVNPHPSPIWNNPNKNWNQGQNWNQNQNQPFNQNQGWNPNPQNQGWNNQPQNSPVEPVVIGQQPATQNPYQSNQPNNWS